MGLIVGSIFLVDICGECRNFCLLPDASNSPAQGYSPAEVLSGLREFCAAESGSVGLAREIRASGEIESLIRWADGKGIFANETRAPEVDDLTGGEHLVTLGLDEKHVLKTTHPGKFGFGVDVEMIHPRGWNAKPRITAGLVDASPEEYVFRLLKQNELFADNISVIGVVRFPQGVSVLTSQPFYKGCRTEQVAIDEWFTSQGWTKVALKAGAFFRAEDDLLIMDALPRNVLTLENGELMPFDVVIVRPSEMLKCRLML